jgi:DNA-binding beta-propeller fold protein YncE
VSSGLFGPNGLAFDSAGNLYVANLNGTIDKITPEGRMSLFASGLNAPAGLAFDDIGDLYVATADDTVVEHTPGGTTTIFASTGSDEPVRLVVASVSEPVAPAVFSTSLLVLAALSARQHRGLAACRA